MVNFGVNTFVILLSRFTGWQVPGEAVGPVVKQTVLGLTPSSTSLPFSSEVDHEDHYHGIKNQDGNKAKRPPAHPALVELTRCAGEKQNHRQDHGITQVALSRDAARLGLGRELGRHGDPCRTARSCRRPSIARS